MAGSFLHCSIASFLARLAGVAAALCASTAFAEVVFGPGEYGLLDYTSNVDDSTHQYGLYVPTTYDASREQGYALIIHGGGYGYTADADFYPPWNDPANAIFLNYDGRHRLQYDGVAQKDLLQVMDDLQQKYNIDTTRVYFEGHSMGSTGALRIGYRFPDRFAAIAGGAGFVDYNEWYERWYAQGPVGQMGTVFSGPEWQSPLLEQSSVVDIAENAKHVPTYFTAGTRDSINRVFGARNLNARLTDLGYNHTYLEADTDHGAGYYWFAAIDYFLSNDFHNDPYTPDVVYKTNQLKYNEAYWTRIDRLSQHLEWAQIETSMDGVANRIDVSVANITQYTLKLSSDLLQANGLDAAQPVNVYTNGVLSYSGPAEQVTLYASLGQDNSIGGWSTTNTLPGGLVKTHDIEGPIGHAFESRFQLLYGNGYQHEADVFVRDWNNPMGMGGNISALPMSSISQSMIDNNNLILFGTTDSNSILSQLTYDESLPFNIPIEVTDEFINIGGKIYSTEEYGIFMIYPNPLNPEKYVVVSEGTMFDSNLGWDLETLPWAWPDYVVFDKSFIYDPATMSDVQGLPYLESLFAEAGYFDNNWNLTAVPEPATCILLAVGLAGLGFRRKLKIKNEK